MARLLFVSLPLHGHLDWGGLAATAAAARRAGHEAAWASGPAVREALTSLGVDFLPLEATGWQPAPPLPEGLSPAEQAEHRRRRGLEAWLNPDALGPAVEALRAALRRWQPDVVTAEPYAAAAAVGAEQLDVPLVVGGRPALAMGAATRAASAAGHAAQALLRRMGVAGRYWDLAAGQIRSPWLHVDFFARPWYADVSALGEQTRFVGGVHGVVRETTDPTPTVLLTLGSLFNDDPAFFRIAAQAVVDEGAHALVVTGGEGKAAPTGLPAGVEVHPWVDFDRVLPRMAAVIHHGGVGTTHAALRMGLPQGVVPHAGDQHAQAGRVTAAGVGYGIAPRDFTLPAARWLVRRLLGDAGVAACARKWQAELAGLGGIEEAAVAIAQIAGRDFDLGRGVV